MAVDTATLSKWLQDVEEIQRHLVVLAPQVTSDSALKQSYHACQGTLDLLRTELRAQLV